MLQTKQTILLSLILVFLEVAFLRQLNNLVFHTRPLDSLTAVFLHSFLVRLRGRHNFLGRLREHHRFQFIRSLLILAFLEFQIQILESLLGSLRLLLLQFVLDRFHVEQQLRFVSRLDLPILNKTSFQMHCLASTKHSWRLLRINHVGLISKLKPLSVLSTR